MINRLRLWFAQRRALIEQIRELEHEAGYFRAIVKREFDQIEIVNLEAGPKGFEMALKGDGFAGMQAEFMMQALKACGAKHYVETSATHPEFGQLTFTVQRVEGETPAAKASRIKDLLRRFRDYCSETVMTGGAHHNPIWAEVADAIGDPDEVRS